MKAVASQSRSLRLSYGVFFCWIFCFCDENAHPWRPSLSLVPTARLRAITADRWSAAGMGGGFATSNTDRKHKTSARVFNATFTCIRFDFGASPKFFFFPEFPSFVVHNLFYFILYLFQNKFTFVRKILLKMSSIIQYDEQIYHY